MAERQNKKEKIREAAIQVMAGNGYHYATTDKIAQAVGIAVGTIYNYFRSKEEILEYIFQVEVEKRFQYYELLRAKDFPALEKLRLLLNRHFAQIMAEPTIGQIMVRERYSPLDRQLPAIRDFILGVPSRIEQLLSEAVQRGEIRPCDTAVVALALWGSVEAVASKAVFETDGDAQRALLMKAGDELVDLYCQGLEITGRA